MNIAVFFIHDKVFYKVDIKYMYISLLIKQFEIRQCCPYN